MDFLKKHYEKVLLGVVLFALAAAVAFLPFKIASERDKLDEMIRTVTNPNPKPLTNLDLAGPEGMLKRMAVPAQVDFSVPNRLFNPTPWQKSPDGALILMNSTNIGPQALVVVKRVPLYLTISLDDVTVTDAGTRFKVGVEKEASANPRDWRTKESYCKVGDKNDTFAVREAKAVPGSGTNVTLTLELNDTGERVAISREKPFKRIDGYKVDMKYPPEKANFRPGLRVGATISFNGEDYNIVAITEDEVILSAKSNQKKTTVKYSLPAARPPEKASS
jgi:hypothetical protein